MNWFCKQIHIDYCKECGLAYKKESYGDLTEYCSIHREPRLVLMRRKQLVMAWAGVNWEKLEPQALEAQAQQYKAFGGGGGGMTAQDYYQQQAMAAQQSGVNSFFGNFLGLQLLLKR